MAKNNILLDVRDLSTHFFTRRGVVRAVDNIGFFIREGEVLGLVGETGCGKSVTALSVIRLIEHPGKIVSGEIRFNGTDLLKLELKGMREIRGRDISMIFQEPKAALNPVLTVRTQLVEGIQAHQDVGKEEAERIALETLASVGLPEPFSIMKRYPHELSGGMAQRVVISVAVAARPKLLIADEPTSSLDVTIQAQIVDLLKNLVKEIGTSVLFITHDLGVAADICDRIAVLYAGNVAEMGSVEQIFTNPLHPYTQSLLRAVPKPGVDKGELYVISGEVPNMVNPPLGCRFHPRCSRAMEVCSRARPEWIELEQDHFVSCYLYS